ncbi:MAG: GatB/YqeY domain-containing protein [Actinomycetota bacterium]|nr:GatB/YqeY domain-containing protein [Actinomycetota bacterium]
MDRDLIISEITKAMREKDKPRLSILRLVKNEIDIKEKESGETVSDADVVALVKKLIKQTGETLEASIKADTDADRTALLQTQVDILAGYLPKQVAGDELAAIVDRVVAENGISEKRDMGRAIGLVIAETDGNCDKAEVARLVGSKLV